jgi:hypothetical protein
MASSGRTRMSPDGAPAGATIVSGQDAVAVCPTVPRDVCQVRQSKSPCLK